MKTLTVLIITCALAVQLNAQYREGSAPSRKPLVIARISLITPKLVVDLAPTPRFTFSAGFWFRPDWWTRDGNDNLQFHPIPSLNPRITFEPRYFFNQGYRARTGKRTDYYSGWYVGIPFYIEFPRQKYNLGSTFGWQCTFGRRWYWNIELGPGFSLEDSRFSFSGSGDVSFGIVLN